jgi:hypothetical protein
MKAYILVYSDSLGTRDEVKECLNKMSEVKYWRYDMPYSFYIISNADAKSIATNLRQLRGNKGRFIITELNENKHGWLTKESWFLIANKRYMPPST